MDTDLLEDLQETVEALGFSHVVPCEEQNDPLYARDETEALQMAAYVPEALGVVQTLDGAEALSAEEVSNRASVTPDCEHEFERQSHGFFYRTVCKHCGHTKQSIDSLNELATTYQTIAVRRRYTTEIIKFCLQGKTAEAVILLANRMDLLSRVTTPKSLSVLMKDLLQ